MSTLTNTTPAVTYSGLLQIPSGLNGDIRPVEDGLGNSLPFSVSEDGFDLTSQFLISGVLVTSSAAELNYLDRSQDNGKTEANKAVVANAFSGIHMMSGHLASGILSNYAENYKDRGSALSSIDFSLSSGHIQEVILTGTPVTFNFYNPPSGNVHNLTLIVKQDSAGSREVTWPSSVYWPDNTPPVLSTGGFNIDIFDFLTSDGGVKWYGTTKGLNFG